MNILCKKCNHKFSPLFNSYVYNGSERIIHGNESILNGSKYKTIKKFYSYICPYCSTDCN